MIVFQELYLQKEKWTRVAAGPQQTRPFAGRVYNLKFWTKGRWAFFFEILMIELATRLRFSQQGSCLSLLLTCKGWSPKVGAPYPSTSHWSRLELIRSPQRQWCGWTEKLVELVALTVFMGCWASVSLWTCYSSPPKICNNHHKKQPF